MALRISSVFAILFGTLFLSTGQGLHQALIPIAASDFEFNPVVLSVLASVYFGGYLAGCLLAPRLIKRVGHTRTLAIAASLLSALSMTHILVPNEILWILIRVFVGYCFASIDVVLESWLADRAEPQDRGKLLSFYRLIDLMSLGLGQFLIANASPTEFTLFAYVAILVSVSVIVVSGSVAPAPAPPESIQVRFAFVYAMAPLAIVAAALHGVGSGIYWGFAPVFASFISEDRTMTGLILAATLFGAALAQFPVGWASDRFDRRKVLMFMSLLATMAALFVAASSFYMKDVIVLAMLLFGATSFGVFPVAMTYAFDRSKPENFVEVGAVVMVSYGIGAFVGPLLTPLALQFGNQSGAFVLIGFFYFLVFGYALYRRTQTSPVVEEEFVEFISVPATTPTALEIDPRVDVEPDEAPGDAQGSV